MEHILALVAVENVAYHFDILYGYFIPDDLKSVIRTGSRVMVNFGRSKNTKRQGVVFGFGKTEKTTGYKSIISVLDPDGSAICEEMLEIARFLKNRTFCTYYEAIKVQMPSGLNYKTVVRYFAKECKEDILLSSVEDEVYRFMLTLDEPTDKKYILTRLGIDTASDVIESLVRKNLVVTSYSADKNVGDATSKTVRLVSSDFRNDSSKLSPKQKDIVNILEDIGSCTVKELCYFTGYTPSVIKNLEKRAIVEIYDSVYYRIPKSEYSADKGKEITLNSEQKKAFDELKARLGSGGVSLLYGVTGSGKTSVFLNLIDEVVLRGEQVIVMVPEISLTPQMMAVFKGRYGDNVAIFHSALSAGERHDEYMRVKKSLVQIVVGTRSAVFAPFDNIGLIVIDEEQEYTYKSESSPRYHTVDVARFRAVKHNALVVLSSATPSINSFSYAVQGKYTLHRLTERYGDAVLPDVELVDMKQERKSGNKYNISSALLEKLEYNLQNGKQSILLINRRGYNTFVTCDACGSVVNCPHCSISMTYHSANNRLMCHYCGYSVPLTRKCSACGKEEVRYSGYGTQRIEEEVAELLPEARLLRMDTDSTSSRHSFEKGLVDFGEKKYDIMLGTQMVAKGLNFDNVTLVGVINADQQLNNDDFRSEERTFDLLTQVVGRSGRGSFKGNAVIQTLTPENHIIQLAQKQDFESFYNNEIVIRKALIYPPYCDLCVVSFIGEDEVKTLNCSRDFFGELQNFISEKYSSQKVIVLGPMPSRISKMNNKFRYRMIIKCRNNNDFRNLISELLIKFGKNSKYSSVTVSADINPENIL